MKYSLVRRVLCGASQMGTQVYMLRRLELQLLMPRTARSCQEGALQELFSSSGFVPQRTYILQGIYSCLLFVAFAITWNVYKREEIHNCVHQVDPIFLSPREGWGRMNSVIQEKEATLTVREWKSSQWATAWLKLPADKKGLATPWGRDQAVLPVQLGNRAVLEGGWDSFIMK